MAGLVGMLPAPSRSTWDRDDFEREQAAKRPVTDVAVIGKCQAPPYGNRDGWRPRTQEDFGDGGAYPECHMAQFPLGMGKKGGGGTSNALAVQLDAEGKVKYDVLARQGHAKDRVVFSKFTDLLPAEVKSADDPSLQRPDDEETMDNTERTRRALEKLTQSKVAAALPARAAERPGEAEFIRYTPSQQGAAYNSGAKQRIIRMVEVQKDPMEPPKFKVNKKIPRGPPSPPAPVMHSPTRKVTAKEQAEWKIPPCISNWKNAKGYTIPLDKRLAADGRGLQQQHVNENFAKLAEALYIADRKAREAVEMRAQLERHMAQNERDKKEENLRMLAKRAREQRAGIERRPEPGVVSNAEMEREKLREERHYERKRERNLAKAGGGDRQRKGRERDVSEQIALGVPNPGHGSGETQYDSRLFNQNKGLDTGFADDESYGVYDKPWRSSGTVSNAIYRPSKNLDNDIYGDDLDKISSAKQFVPEKEFSGTDRAAGSSRSGPVQFQKEQEDDPFGLTSFFKEAKTYTERKRPASPEPSSSRRDDKRKKK
ncbi:unnamed protein product [Cyprideis torosa]|uniref:Uncharacterized protein n=1 Tax=Cyprideis torosa TaxID=163714 RepID=A0A7R8WIY4_9CRUS|nr:unnamed protein product [Cyprideis torosa]CAG0895032.1 unnamed protein product [Cyprideis torosa]